MKQHGIWFACMVFFIQIAFIPSIAHASVASNNAPGSQSQPQTKITLSDIVVIGNETVPEGSILRLLPFTPGSTYAPEKSSDAIKRLYGLGRFQDVQFFLKPLDDGTYTLIIAVREKYRVIDFIISGNRQVSATDISNKLDLTNLSAIDESQLHALATRIKLLYAEKGFHDVIINTRLDIDNQKNAIVVFEIHEQKQSLVKQIHFVGNQHYSDKTLRGIIFTREDWLLGFMDRSGSYQKEKVEADKQALEQYYLNHGFLQARVANVKEDLDPVTKHFCLTYELIEGPQYTVSEVSVPDCPPYTEAQLLSRVPIIPGQLYSRERIMSTIQNLEALYGNLGYIFTSVDPVHIPDEAEQTVSIRFEIETAQKYIIDRINITGNRKTRDKVIRRQIILQEGQQLNTAAMEISKNRVEATGYFEMQDGVNWKIERKPGGLADLNLIVNETKTGNASIQMGFGGSEFTIQSPLTGFSTELNISDINVMGTGIRANLMGKFAKEEKSILFNITDPYIFDLPLFGALDGYHQRYTYADLRFTNAVNEKHSGGSITSGFATSYSAGIFSEIFCRSILGVESITYDSRPTAMIVGMANIPPAEAKLAQANYNALLQREFDPGRYPWFSTFIGQDLVNHPIHPSMGYTWTLRSHIGIPSPLSNIGFYKFDLDYNWYTPLIGAYDLVFHWHSYFGYVSRIGQRSIPYADLYHIGGDNSVRGFLYGQIGPQFAIGEAQDSIGGKKTLYINAEFIFPIMPDMTIKALFFYDGGAGWNNPYLNNIDRQFIRNNNFDYRHSVGFGIRMLNPMPVRIDWGFKLDPRPGETSHQVHFGMSNSF